MACALLLALACGLPDALAETARPGEAVRAAAWPGFWGEYAVRRGVLLVIAGSVLVGIWLAHRGKVLPSRDLPGLLALGDAVARATEMGRPTLFTAGGACRLERVQLYGAMPILREAARLSGQLDNRLIVPICYPETMPLHINTVREGLLDAGAPEAYRAEDVRFFPGGQFFFAMAAMGWMLEEQPAACFYFGHWEADSLMFAETGQAIEALQIAGTDALPQVPFFVVSCDFTLIGEEFWSASAKLSGDPHLLGSLGAQDLLKLGVMVLIVLGCALSAVPHVDRFVALLRGVFR